MKKKDGQTEYVVSCPVCLFQIHYLSYEDEDIEIDCVECDWDGSAVNGQVIDW